MAKNIRDLVGASQSRDFVDLVDSKMNGTEDYGYALKGTSPALPEFDEDTHGDRADYYGETQRVTVSEFIRQADPKWEHVATTEKRSSTLPFSGAPVVMTGAGGYSDQMDQFNKQVLGIEDPSTYLNLSNSKEVEYVEVDDLTEQEKLEQTNRRILGLD